MYGVCFLFFLLMDLTFSFFFLKISLSFNKLTFCNNMDLLLIQLTNICRIVPFRLFVNHLVKCLSQVYILSS
jgi:hypothetical protein